MDNGWSRSVLEHQIDGGLYERQGKAINNFQLKLPEQQSDLAEQTLKIAWILNKIYDIVCFISPSEIKEQG
ncbi:hypothetical protein [Anaerostipes sp.]|uniref:hypothetical protein n=1 Tax=Anaerostipes sp. TaxID=1872530 RepID=UPI0025B8157C|nr:hypothetical protein [Anaerostipes sp.]